LTSKTVLECDVVAQFGMSSKN